MSVAFEDRKMHYFTPEKLIATHGLTPVVLCLFLIAGMNEIGKVSLMFFKKDCMGRHACEVACKQEYQTSFSK